MPASVGQDRLDSVPRPQPPSLKAALRRNTVGLIAEIKRRSPSQGKLNEGLDPRAQSRAFEKGGASAISVLTEPDFFSGSLDDLEAVRSSVSLPVLRKDFHVHPSQLFEAQFSGASAALLIVRAIPPGDLPVLVATAREIHLETVVEVRTEEELRRALDTGAEIIGVNSRDLETLEVDPTVPERLVPKIPRDVIAIWESGVSSVEDVERAANLGADAVLVGSALSRSADPEALVRSLSMVKRTPRG